MSRVRTLCLFVVAIINYCNTFSAIAQSHSKVRFDLGTIDSVYVSIFNEETEDIRRFWANNGHVELLKEGNYDLLITSSKMNDVRRVLEAMMDSLYVIKIPESSGVLSHEKSSHFGQLKSVNTLVLTEPSNFVYLNGLKFNQGAFLIQIPSTITISLKTEGKLGKRKTQTAKKEGNTEWNVIDHRLGVGNNEFIKGILLPGQFDFSRRRYVNSTIHFATVGIFAVAAFNQSQQFNSNFNQYIFWKTQYLNADTEQLAVYYRNEANAYQQKANNALIKNRILIGGIVAVYTINAFRMTTIRKKWNKEFVDVSVLPVFRLDTKTGRFTKGLSVDFK